MIKVMVVDDQTILAEGIKSVIETDGEIKVVSLACDGEDALKKMKENYADVVLMDIRMPNMNGVVATKELKNCYPSAKIVVLTTFDDSDYILGAINNGASGYLLKDIGGEGLIDAIKKAYAGDTILPSKIAKRITEAAKLVSDSREILLKRTFGLSDREAEIALMLFEGFTNRQIASALKISEGTARNYISGIYIKLKCENRQGAVSVMKDIIKQ